MTAMKLQKLTYYAQAWHLAWHGEELFAEPIEAWANGPVVRDLYEVHRGQFSISAWPGGHPETLSLSQRATIDAVLATYGTRDARWLADQTHREKPWRHARRGVPNGVRSEAPIEPKVMQSFYRDELRAGRGPESVAVPL